MPLLNELFDKVSQDREFLISALEKTSKSDEFTSKLLNIYKSLDKNHFEDEIVLCIHRSDYMLDEPSQNILQVN